MRPKLHVGSPKIGYRYYLNNVLYVGAYVENHTKSHQKYADSQLLLSGVLQTNSGAMPLLLAADRGFFLQFAMFRSKAPSIRNLSLHIALFVSNSQPATSQCLSSSCRSELPSPEKHTLHFATFRFKSRLFRSKSRLSWDAVSVGQ